MILFEEFVLERLEEARGCREVVHGELSTVALALAIFKHLEAIFSLCDLQNFEVSFRITPQNQCPHSDLSKTSISKQGQATTKTVLHDLGRGNTTA